MYWMDHNHSTRRRPGGTGASGLTRALRGGLAAVILGAGLIGCVQGEELFLRQNRASAALAYTIMDVEVREPEAVERLYDAEQELSLACAPLQEAGARSIRQEEIGIGLHLEIFGALDHCAAVCHQVERLVWQVDPEIARTYLDMSELAAVSDR